jgi:NTE family protein
MDNSIQNVNDETPKQILPDNTESVKSVEQNEITEVTDQVIKSKKKYKNLVMSGGSVKGTCHIGALSKLWDDGLITDIKACAGTSAGALLGCLLIIGFNPSEIWDFILSIDVGKLVRPDLFLFLKECGVDTGKVIFNLFEEILTKKTGIKHITFQQLYEFTKISFTVVGSCLTTKEAVYYSHTNTPNFKVSVALRISIGIPGFFTPVILDGKKYIDGGVLDNFPMSLFKDELEDTIGILICGDDDTNYEYPEQYPMAVMNLFLHNFQKLIYDKYQSQTIYLKCNVDEISCFSFELDDCTKKKLFDIGYDSATEYLKKFEK